MQVIIKSGYLTVSCGNLCAEITWGSGLFHTIYFFVKINKLWLTGSA